MDGLTTTLTIFSAMITPVVLISASGTLTLSTSNRLIRVIERARKLAETIQQLVQSQSTKTLPEQRRVMIYNQLVQVTKRVRLLHRAMTSLYLSLSFFIATSVSLGIVAITHTRFSGVPIFFGVAGVTLLFYASLLLIAETRIARIAIDEEMNYVLQLGEQLAPEKIAELLS